MTDRAEPATKTIAASRGRILIVEDDFLIARLLEDYLIESGFNVVGVAPSADKALALAEAERPEIAIVDIRLVGPRDGVEVAQQFYQAFGLRSIFATAHTDPATRARAATARPLGWLQKPYAFDAVIRMLDESLRGVRE